MDRPPLIALMGPTASGKTDLAVAAVERWPVDLVSVDSALVYRGMDIGSAKPDAATLARAPHRLIDIREPWEPYSAADFATDARREIAEIHAAGRIPLLVGGTGLYFRALLDGLSPMPAADPATREAIEAEAAEKGWSALHAELIAVDPAAAARIGPADAQRISRALEVHRLTGRPISEWQREASTAPGNPWRTLKLVVGMPRERLHQRIALRFQLMLEAGFLDEMTRLRADPRIHPDLPSMRAVGYRQAWRHLDGDTDRETFIAEGVAATRQLCKRQVTWLRKELDASWLDAGNPVGDFAQRVAGFLG